MAFPVTEKFRITQADGTLTTSYQLIMFPKKVQTFYVEHRGNKGEGEIVVDILDGSIGSGGETDNFSVTRGGSKSWRSTSGINKIYLKYTSSTGSVPTVWEVGSSR